MEPANESVIGKLIGTLPQEGMVTWIGIRPERRSPIVSLPEVDAIANRGLVGDHYQGTATSTRQVTLLQAEHLEAVASFLGMASIDPALVRRNLVISGINLLALKDKSFYVGDALLQTTGLCHPCSRMEEVLGVGGYNAMRGHGGIMARIVKSGTIRIHDKVYVVA